MDNKLGYKEFVKIVSEIFFKDLFCLTKPMQLITSDGLINWNILHNFMQAMTI